MQDNPEQCIYFSHGENELYSTPLALWNNIEVNVSVNKCSSHVFQHFNVLFLH